MSSKLCEFIISAPFPPHRPSRGSSNSLFLFQIFFPVELFTIPDALPVSCGCLVDPDIGESHHCEGPIEGDLGKSHTRKY